MKKYYVPENPCKRCGMWLNYTSTRRCVQCALDATKRNPSKGTKYMTVCPHCSTQQLYQWHDAQNCKNCKTTFKGKKWREKPNAS